MSTIVLSLGTEIILPFLSGPIFLEGAKEEASQKRDLYIYSYAHVCMYMHCTALLIDFLSTIMTCNPWNVAEERDGPVPENLDRQGDCPGPGLSGLCAYCPQVY